MVTAAAFVMLGFAHGRLIDCDMVEVGYVPLAEVGAEFMFQVVAGRADKAAVIVPRNLAVLRMDSGDSECPAV